MNKKKIILIIAIEIILAFVFVMSWDKLREIKILEFFVTHFRDILSY